MRPFALAINFGALFEQFSAHLQYCLQNISWLALAAVLVLGTALTIHMFSRRSLPTRSLAWNILLATILLAAGIFLHSKAITWIVVAYIAALVVIYQPEFREALTKVSVSRALLTGKHPVATVDHYHELSKS